MSSSTENLIPADAEMEITEVDVTSVPLRLLVSSFPLLFQTFSLILLSHLKLPTELEQRMDALKDEGALRPTIITPSPTWHLTRQSSLLDDPKPFEITSDRLKSEKNKAFDLLDALTKSGALVLEGCSVHVVIGSTHCFDLSLMALLVQDNVNPIEVMERSAAIVASVIHQRPWEELVEEVRRREMMALLPPSFLV